MKYPVRVSFIHALVLAALAACATGPKTVPHPEGVSPTPPKVSPFSSNVTPTDSFSSIASVGGCEPTYRNGTKGMCVNGRPCRGYGVRNDRGQDQCVCYLAKSGCDSKSRCDLPEHACVPDDESTDDGD
jgi:hypothetical protein